MSGRLRIQTQVLLAPRPRPVTPASEIGTRLSFLIPMPTCSKAGGLESRENRGRWASFSWPTCFLDFASSATVQLGLAYHQCPGLPLPGPGAPLSLEYLFGVVSAQLASKALLDSLLALSLTSWVPLDLLLVLSGPVFSSLTLEQ